MATSDYASPAQARLMRARAHGWKPDKPRGRLPSAAVAKEFVDVKDRGKPKKMQLGGTVSSALEQVVAQNPELKAQLEAQQGEQVRDFISRDFRNPETGEYGFFGGMFRNLQDKMEAKARERGLFQPVYGYGDGDTSGGYRVPQPAPPGMTAEPGSIASEIYDKYGITDPTATRYDLTSQERMREDPYAHLDPSDPARQQYERWDLGRAPVERGDPSSFYPEPSGMRVESPYRTQLREHKERIANILGGDEPVEMQFGGLAQAAMGRQRGSMGRRGSPQMRAAMQRPQMRGNDAMRPTPQMMNMMRRKMMRGRPGGGRRGMVAPGLRKQVGLGRPPGGRVQPGGPGGPMGGRPELLDAARMPGGRAAPFRGLQQKMQAQRRTTPGGNRVGMRDQQGGLSRAMQTQTGRPPISRRAAFPGSRQNQY